MNASDRTTANEVAELEYDGDPSYMDQAATYYDDKKFNDALIMETYFHFSESQSERPLSEVALLDIFQHFVQYETYPDWIEPLIDRVAKEGFG